MDSIITAAARALAVGDPLGALNWVALRNDPSALALRGIAMARLGDLPRAIRLLRSAASGFGTTHAKARARCVLAEAEIALVSRDLGWSAQTLKAAREVLDAHGDTINRDYARHLEIRHLLLIGRVDEAALALSTLDPTSFAPPFRAAHELVIAGIAIRRLETSTAKAALSRAREAARQTLIPALDAEIESASLILTKPAARLITQDGERSLLLEQVEVVLASDALVVDACRYSVHRDTLVASLKTRPVLFTLARILGEAWPAEVPRDVLIARAFRLRFADDSHRARLRVEIGRLRKALRGIADVTATKRGFKLTPRHAAEVAVLAQPTEEKYAAVLALLADGEAWASSALALVLETSPRTVQRALDSLAEEGKVQSAGRGRARRWMASTLPGFTTTLLLPGPLPSD